MCLACEEEAFYRAYLAHMEKKAKEAAAAERGTVPAVCDEVKERTQVGSTRLAHSKRLISGKPEISAREASGKQ